MKLKSTFLIVFSVLYVLIVISCIYLFLPRSIAATIGIDPSNTKLCSVIRSGRSGPSTDFVGDDLDTIMDLLASTDVKLEGSALSFGTPLDTIRYHMDFQTDKNDFISTEITSNGYFIFNSRVYKILSEQNESSILNFLRIHVSSIAAIK